MAIIYSYPSVASIENPDLFIISRVPQDPDEISNFSVTADALATFVTARVNLNFQGGVGTGIVNLDTQSLNVIGTTNEIETTANAQTLQIGLPDNVTITNNLTVGGESNFTGQVTVDSGAVFNGQVLVNYDAASPSNFISLAPATFYRDINMSSNFGTTNPNLRIFNGNIFLYDQGRVKNMLDPVDSQDAATKSYVDSLVSGGLSFRGSFRADTGEILTGVNAGSYLYNCPGGAGTRVSVITGDYYIVANTGGNFYCSGDLLNVGDSIMAVADAPADSSTVTDWATLESDNIEGTGTANTIPLWTDSQVLGNSLLSQDALATRVMIGGDISGQGTIEGESLTINTGPSTLTGSVTFEGAVTLEDDISINGTVNMNSGTIENLADPTAAQEAATKAYADTKVDGTGTTQTLPVWSDGPNGVLSNSPIKVVQSTSTPSPTFGENILIGSTLDLAVESKKTLQIGDDNIIGSLLGKTKNSLLVGQENSIIASATKPEIINSAVVGLQNEVTANNSLVAGRGNVVQSNASFVTGSSNVTSSAPRQFVIGRQNTVDSEDAAVLGDENTVTTITTGHKGAMVFGNLNNVLGDRVFCLGTSNTVASDNQNAFIIGKGNTSTANNSYSIGLQNSISGNDSYALGKLNTSASPSSVAIGIDNELNGEKAYAFGNNNSNIGIESFAIGRKNNGITNDGVSAARETYLIGFENKLVTDNTIILGRFSDTTVLSTDSTEERSTIAFAVGSSDSKRRTAWEFRGRSKNFGNTKAGDSMRIMAHALRYSTSYVNDADAGNGGVEMGQLYRNGSDVKIRMDGNEPSEATYLVPFNVTASPGGSSTLVAADIATLVKISWSGVNGTYTLNLPPAADMQYRKVRFISDGTFGTGAGDKVLITPNGTETVDGASNFEVSKSYEGVALWSDGTEWIIIQAKAH